MCTRGASGRTRVLNNLSISKLFDVTIYICIYIHIYSLYDDLSIKLILNAELNLLFKRQGSFIHHLIDDAAHREDAADAGAYFR